MPGTSIYRAFDLKNLKQLWASRDCVFCQLVRHTLESHYGKQYTEQMCVEGPESLVFLSWTPLDISYDVYTRDAGKRAAFCIEIALDGVDARRHAMQTDDEFDGAHTLPKIQALVPDEQVDWTPLLGRAVDSESIDWGHIKSWMDICDLHHPRPLINSSDKPRQGARPNLQLCAIDVERDCIVMLPPDSSYIALSYMWGKDQRVKLKLATREAMSTPGYFATAEGQPSRTIVHAFAVAKRLGCRYLWVDALCITQDDAANIQANVSSMDQVYAGAWLTIVAASGLDADSGLPGVSKEVPRSVRQMRIIATRSTSKKGITMANMLDSEMDAVNASRWNTRGWTYQERLLSRRLLVFTSSQAFYCDSGCDCREDVHRLMDNSSATMSIYDPRFQLDFDNDNIFDIYAVAVAEYTKRQLTSSEDKVKAMNGLLNLLETPFRGPFFFGLPITLFDVALLWIPTNASKRCNLQFPSWSWAGWDGAMRYAQRDSLTNMCECTASLSTIETMTGVRLCSEESPVNLSTFSPGGKNGEWERHFEEDTQQITYTRASPSNSTAVYPGRRYLYPRPLAPFPPKECSQLHAPLPTSIDPKLRGPHVLRVRAKTARFLLTGVHSGAYVPTSTCREGKHVQCHLAMLDSGSPSRIAGTVFVPGQSVSSLQNKKHRFLALSRSTMYRTDMDESWSEEAPGFRPWSEPGEDNSPWKERRRQEDEEELFSETGVNVSYREVFSQDFNIKTPWPVLNVLLLSEPRDGMEGGVVERLGIGKVHIDAFNAIAKEETIFLG